jgi:hypothetical protein
MTLKIERNSDGRRKLIRLIGQARSEHLEELKKQAFYECVLLLAVIMIYVAIRY